MAGDFAIGFGEALSVPSITSAVGVVAIGGDVVVSGENTASQPGQRTFAGAGVEICNLVRHFGQGTSATEYLGRVGAVGYSDW